MPTSNRKPRRRAAPKKKVSAKPVVEITDPHESDEITVPRVAVGGPEEPAPEKQGVPDFAYTKATKNTDNPFQGTDLEKAKFLGSIAEKSADTSDMDVSTLPSVPDPVAPAPPAPSANVQDRFTRFLHSNSGMGCMDLRLPADLGRLHSVMRDRLHRAYVAGWNERGTLG